MNSDIKKSIAQIKLAGYFIILLELAVGIMNFIEHKYFNTIIFLFLFIFLIWNQRRFIREHKKIK